MLVMSFKGSLEDVNEGAFDFPLTVLHNVEVTSFKGPFRISPLVSSHAPLPLSATSSSLVTWGWLFELKVKVRISGLQCVENIFVKGCLGKLQECEFLEADSTTCDVKIYYELRWTDGVHLQNHLNLIWSLFCAHNEYIFVCFVINLQQFE